MLLARREVGALTRALQRCLPRRRPSFSEHKLDAVARRFLQPLLGGVAQVVGLDAVGGGARATVVAVSVNARTCSGCEAARTTQPSDMRMCAWSTKRMGVACGEGMWGKVGEEEKAKREAESEQGRKQKPSKEASKNQSLKELKCAAHSLTYLIWQLSAAC